MASLSSWLHLLVISEGFWLQQINWTRSIPNRSVKFMLARSRCRLSLAKAEDNVEREGQPDRSVCWSTGQISVPLEGRLSLKNRRRKRGQEKDQDYGEEEEEEEQI